MVTILIVDDEDIVLKNLKILLGHQSRTILTASGGITALEYLRNYKNNIDLVVLDIMMPDMSGLEVLRIMKDEKDLTSIPVILHTGLPDSQDALRGVELGAVSVLAKLGSLQEKHSVIENILQRVSANKNSAP